MNIISIAVLVALLVLGAVVAAVVLAAMFDARVTLVGRFGPWLASLFDGSLFGGD